MFDKFTLINTFNYFQQFSTKFPASFNPCFYKLILKICIIFNATKSHIKLAKVYLAKDTQIL